MSFRGNVLRGNVVRGNVVGGIDVVPFFLIPTKMAEMTFLPRLPLLKPK
jgi:hypothetical protein